MKAHYLGHVVFYVKDLRTIAGLLSRPVGIQGSRTDLQWYGSSSYLWPDPS